MVMKTPHVTHQQASGLLHNKFVVVLGSSFQRGVYKDLVLLLQKDSYLSQSQLKTKGEEHFENDDLLEGGRKGLMSNGTQYKEVREYTSDHHLVRFYFITRVYSEYMRRVLEDFENGLKPDLVIVNSCVWDVSRYGRRWEPDYLNNLTTFFERLRAILPEEALIIWNLTMPLGETIIGGFLVPEVAEIGPSLRFDIIEANYCSATLASVYGLDVLDLHFQFRFSLQHRMRDGVHWNAVAHRRVTCLLLAQIADAWGVELPPSQPPKGLNQSFSEDLTTKAMYRQPRNVHIPVSRWRPQEWRVNFPLPATSWKAPHFYGVTRWRPQERRPDCYPLPDSPWKGQQGYRGMNQGFSRQDTAPNQQYQQPRNTQNSATRWRVQERRADCLPLLEIPTKAPSYYGGLNRPFSEPYPAAMKMFQQARNAPNSANDLSMTITRRFQEQMGDQYLPPNSLLNNPPCNGDTRWKLQERRVYFHLPPATPTKPSHCYGGLTPSFSYSAINGAFQPPRIPQNVQNAVRRVSLVSQNRPNPATNHVYQQPRNAPNAGLNQSFSKQDLATSVMYQQPRHTQDSVTRWRLQERRPDCYPLPDSPWKGPRYYGGRNQSLLKQDLASNDVYQQPRNAQNAVTRNGILERRDDDLSPAPPTKPSWGYRGLNQHFSQDDPATRWIRRESRNGQDSGPGFSNSNHQCHPPNGNYVMRNKYTCRPHYRPY